MHPVTLPDHGLQVFGFEALLIHAEFDGFDRTGRVNGVMLCFIGLDHQAKNRQAITVGRDYSGKVVATLTGQGDQRMRCRFHLVASASGMSGGGDGQCQLADGRAVQAGFPGK